MRNLGKQFSMSRHKTLLNVLMPPIGVMFLCASALALDPGGERSADGGTWPKYWPPEWYHVEPEHPTSIHSVAITVGGKWPHTCVPHNSQAVIVGNTVHVDANVSSPPCNLTVSYWSITEIAGPLEPGSYDVVVTVYYDSMPVYDPATVCTFEVREILNEMIVVDLPTLARSYPWGAENEVHIDLGFSLFEIEALVIHWMGSIFTGRIDCFGNEMGLGGTFYASCAGARGSHGFFGGAPDTWVPFDVADHFELPSDDSLEDFLDGTADLRVRFPYIIQECTLLSQPCGQLDWVSLIVAARRMHDFDDDGDADLEDGSDLVDCLGGPARSFATGCELFDAERDSDVDLADVGSFQREFTGE